MITVQMVNSIDVDIVTADQGHDLVMQTLNFVAICVACSYYSSAAILVYKLTTREQTICQV